MSDDIIWAHGGFLSPPLLPEGAALVHGRDKLHGVAALAELNSQPFLVRVREVMEEFGYSRDTAFTLVIKEAPDLFRQYVIALAGISEEGARKLHSDRLPAFVQAKAIGTAAATGASATEQLQSLKNDLCALKAIQREHPFEVFANAVQAKHGTSRAQAQLWCAIALPGVWQDYGDWLAAKADYESP